jgi:tRNA-dihydrouridine synthase B
MSLNLYKQLKKNPFLLAPLDNATDIGFRELCEKNKASYTCSELTSVESLIRSSVPKYRYERGNLKINCVQLFGGNIKSYSGAVEVIEDKADIIDINFGCPASSVTKNEAGSKLLKDPKKIGEIVSKVCENTNNPVSAKIRLGYNKINYLDVTKEIEDCGANLITMHGRVAKQSYGDKANWDEIKNLHEKSNIPIVGNGDISCEEDVDKYLNSHCDGMMVGRAAIGNPLIFKKLYHYYKKGEKLEIDDYKENQKKLFLEYLKNIESRDFYKKIVRVKQQAMWFVKGIEGAKELRVRIGKMDNIDDIVQEIKKF